MRRRTNKRIRNRKIFNEFAYILGLSCTLVVIALVGTVVAHTLNKAAKVLKVTAINLPVNISFKDNILHYCLPDKNNSCYMVFRGKTNASNQNELSAQLMQATKIILDRHLQQFCDHGIKYHLFSKCNINELRDAAFSLDLMKQMKIQAEEGSKRFVAKKLFSYNKTCLFSDTDREFCEINRLNFLFKASSDLNIAKESYISSKEYKFIRSHYNSISNLLLHYNAYIKEQHMQKEIFDFRFLTNTNSIYPDFAGIKDSLCGTLLTIAICMMITFPISVLAALFIEEFWKDKAQFLRRIIIISIDNMSAIPSIIYGLLGAVLYINILNLPRSSVIVGGLTLSFIAFPLMVIAARNAIMNVPNEIKDLARVMGASDCRIALKHTLPMAMNGIITGSILTIGRIAGETACLLMVGLTAFNTEVPASLKDKTSTIATQVYSWLEMPDRGFMFRIYGGMGVIIIISFTIALLIRIIRAAKRY